MKLYKNIARSRLFCRIAKRSIDSSEASFSSLCFAQTFTDGMVTISCLFNILIMVCAEYLFVVSYARSPALDGNFASMVGSSMLSPEEQMKYLKSQEGTARLDTFIHYLLVKCNVEV